MTLPVPILLSVPHAGLDVPPALRPCCRLRPEEIAADGDVGAREIFAIAEQVRVLVTTPIARAVLDMNRAEDDRGKDGVFKTHTCWDVPVWEPFPPEHLLQGLLEEHYRPYHARLSELAKRRDLAVAVDAHTMAAVGPPVGPDAGRPRPDVCLGVGEGTCPRECVELLAEAFREVYGGRVTINDPFRGGYITRRHAEEMPWVQLELSRVETIGLEEKRARVLAALELWSDRGFGV